MITTPSFRIAVIPPLENGDLLSREEFEQRYTAMPELKKAELIEGIVYMGSRLRFIPHAEPHAHIMTWLGLYAAVTPNVRVGDNPTVRLDLENEPQPDGLLIIDSQFGGQTVISEDGYIDGTPELVVEVSASSASIDLRNKKQVYCRSGVQEYIVWQVMSDLLDWFFLENGEYISLVPDENGIICSRVFPGLWLQVPAILAGDMATVITTLQAGLASNS